MSTQGQSELVGCPDCNCTRSSYHLFLGWQVELALLSWTHENITLKHTYTSYVSHLHRSLLTTLETIFCAQNLSFMLEEGINIFGTASSFLIYRRSITFGYCNCFALKNKLLTPIFKQISVCSITLNLFLTMKAVVVSTEWWSGTYRRTHGMDTLINQCCSGTHFASSS